MRRFRLACEAKALLCLVLGVASGGCSGDTSGANPNSEPSTSDAQLEVAQVTTLTTVQASSGSFLSPNPQQDVPSYVARAELSAPRPLDGSERARVDVALLFQSPSAPSSTLPAFEAELAPQGGGAWSPVEHHFPSVSVAANRVRWSIEAFRGAASYADNISSEWGGWQAFGGLQVRSPSAPGEASAAAATLDFEVQGARSPLVLTLSESGELVVTNQSNATVERALLIYSHAGGVAVTALDAFGPGAKRITTLGPKERPPEELLERGRALLADFFAASVGAQLAKALAEAKSIPFLETRGFRLISLLGEAQAPARLDVSTPIASRRQVVISHSEILKLEEEARVVEVVADRAIDVAHVATELGRFSEGKLEFAAGNADAAVSARAQALLAELRSQ